MSVGPAQTTVLLDSGLISTYELLSLDFNMNEYPTPAFYSLVTDVGDGKIKIIAFDLTGASIWVMGDTGYPNYIGGTAIQQHSDHTILHGVFLNADYTQHYVATWRLQYSVG